MNCPLDNELTKFTYSIITNYFFLFIENFKIIIKKLYNNELKII